MYIWRVNYFPTNYTHCFILVSPKSITELNVHLKLDVIDCMLFKT